MVIAVARYASLAIDAAKVLHYLGRLYGESTLQEREDIKDHLQEIWKILKKVPERSGEARQTPALLMLPPGDTSWGREIRVNDAKCASWNAPDRFAKMRGSSLG